MPIPPSLWSTSSAFLGLSLGFLGLSVSVESEDSSVFLSSAADSASFLAASASAFSFLAEKASLEAAEAAEAVSWSALEALWFFKASFCFACPASRSLVASFTAS